MYKYQYYEDGKIKRKTPTKGLMGLDIGYYRNGNVEFSIEYDGKEWNGKWLYYYDDGKIQQITYYQNNELNGACTEYYKNGYWKCKYNVRC